jgi:hypothetical protein
MEERKNRGLRGEIGVTSQLSFNDNWVNLIMKCVESLKLSVEINDHISEVFSPSRGIRQGDPLSPYLFLFCAEGLFCLLKHSGPQLSRERPFHGGRCDKVWWRGWGHEGENAIRVVSHVGLARRGTGGCR